MPMEREHSLLSPEVLCKNCDHGVKSVSSSAMTKARKSPEERLEVWVKTRLKPTGKALRAAAGMERAAGREGG